MKKGLIVAAVLVAVCSAAQAAVAPMCGTGNQAGQNKFVPIGDAGNDARPSGYGSVGYTYDISKYEVTAAEFAKSGAGDGDESFWKRKVGKNAPAGNVSLYEAMKYCNWKTSGNVDDGVYQFDDGGNYVGTARAAAIMTYGTVYALPTFDEWYKAAFYNVQGGFWSLYANGTDTPPTHSESRYGTCSPWAVGSGEREQNGTYDMMGNVYEWTEMVVGMEGLAPLCGGSYDRPGSGLSSMNCLNKVPETEGICIGFRMVRLDAAAIPEPATALLFGIGGIGAWLSRRNRLKAREESVA